jgi:uncharacterized protein
MCPQGALYPGGSVANPGAALTRTAERFVLGGIRFYQVAVSPLLGRHCRFHPTCSEYARQAVERYGLRRGGTLAVRRILRCHPFNPGGFDPVPQGAVPATAIHQVARKGQ